MIENEIKFLINSHEYDNLRRTLFTDKNVTSKLQVNYYYDTLNYDLLKKSITFRVRQIEDKLVLQVKYPVNIGQTEGKLALQNKYPINELIRINNEMDMPINKIQKTFYLDDEDLKRNIGDLSKYNNVILMGSLVTHRMSLKYNDWMKLDLDYNLFWGKIDYELEIELLNGYESEVNSFIDKILLDKNKLNKNMGKAKRFFYEKQNLE